MRTTSPRRRTDRPVHLYSDVSATLVASLIAAKQKEQLTLTRDETTPTILYSSRAFHPGTEEVLVNGVHYYTPDYSLVPEGDHAVGFFIPFLQATDDVNAVADLLEN